MQIKIDGHMSEHLIVVAQSESVEAALMKMRSRHIRHLLVVDDSNKFVGLVSDRDLLKNLNENNVSISSIMTTQLTFVDIKDSVEKVIHLMVTRKLSSVLVKKHEEIVGIITSEDMLLLLHSLIRTEGDRPSLIEDFIRFLQKYGQTISSPNYI